MTTTVPKRCDYWLNKSLKYSEMKLFFNLKYCNTAFCLFLKKKESENILSVNL